MVTNKNLSKRTNYFFIVLYVVALIMLYLLFKPFLTFMILGGIIVILTFPLNLWLRKRIKKDSLTAALMTFLVILLILIPSFFFTSSLLKQSYGLINTASTINLDSVSDQITNSLGINVDLKSIVFPAISKFVSFITNSIPSLLGSITELILDLFIMFFLMYYLFKEGDIILQKFMATLPIGSNHKDDFKKETKNVLRGVLYGQFLVAVIQGILGGIGFWIFGVPNPVLWGFIMIIMSFVPFLGTPLIWGPAVIIEFVSGNVGLAIGLLIYSGILVTNIDNFLKPKIIGRETGMHPVLVLLGIFGGIALFGLIGMIIGPVIVALCALIIKFFNREVMFA